MPSFRTILTSACLVFASLLPAAAQKSFSHYFLMPGLYNPAAAGASGMLSVNGIAGIHSLRGDDPDANAYALTASAPIGPVGLGIAASFDKTLRTSPPFRQTTPSNWPEDASQQASEPPISA